MSSEKNKHLPLNLNAQELEKGFKPLFFRFSNRLNIETPIWAQAEQRTMTKYKHPVGFIQDFYEDRGRSYWDTTTDITDPYERLLQDGQTYRAFARPVCSGFFGAYQPIYEEQWFWPLHANIKSVAIPLSDKHIANCLAKDSKLPYSSPEGHFNGDYYLHELTKELTEDGLKETEWSVYKYDLNRMQNAPSFYVGLNTVQRAACLWAVNELLIPMLNADNNIPALWALLPNALGRFSTEEQFAEFNHFYDGADVGRGFEETIADNARIRNKSIILRRILRKNHIPADYDKNMNNYELKKYIDESCYYPEDAWTIPPWDDHIIPHAPAETFFKHVMVKRSDRAARLFGRGALWSATGEARSGLMHAYDLAMIKDALYLALVLDATMNRGVKNYRPLHTVCGEPEDLDYLFNYPASWFGGIGQLKKLPFKWGDDLSSDKTQEEDEYETYEKPSEEEIAERLKARSKIKFPTLAMRKARDFMGSVGSEFDPDVEDATQSTGLTRDDLLSYEHVERATLYDYNNKDIADFVLEELEELNQIGPVKFAEKLKEHYQAMVDRINGDVEVYFDTEKPTLESVYEEKISREVKLPLGVRLTHGELMQVIESVFHGIEDFFTRQEEEIDGFFDFINGREKIHAKLIEEQAFFLTQDLRHLPWYRPVRTNEEEARRATSQRPVQPSGVFYGADVITTLIMLDDDDVLSGEKPEEVVPVLEETIQWSFLSKDK